MKTKKDKKQNYSITNSFTHVILMDSVFLLVFLICLFLVVSVSTADDATELFFRNHYHKAIDAFPASPDNPESSYYLGLCHFKLGMMYMELNQVFLPLALDYYKTLDELPERISERARPSIYTPYYLGLTYLELGDYSHAITMLNRFLQNSPSDKFADYALCALGASYYLAGEKAKAESKFGAISNPSDPSIAVYLAATYQKLGIHENQVRQIFQKERYRDFSSSSEIGEYKNRFYLSLAVIASNQGEHQTALKLIQNVSKKGLDFLDGIDDTQQISFFHPCLFAELGEVHLRRANDIFTNLSGKISGHDEDLHYVNGLILSQLGDYGEARRILKAASFTSNQIISEMAKILIGECEAFLGRTSEAEKIWRTVATDNPIIAVELADAYVTAEVQPAKCAKLVFSALPEIKSATKYSDTEKTSAFYPPFDAFPQEEVYRRAGNTLLKLSQSDGEKKVKRVKRKKGKRVKREKGKRVKREKGKRVKRENGKRGKREKGKMKSEERLIDFAIRAYRLGHVSSHPYTIDEAPWGNDPTLLIDMAYTNYRRGFMHWGGVTEALSVMQRDYPELYPLHLMVQVIYAIRINLHNEKQGVTNSD